jgi:hypothetical protein
MGEDSTTATQVTDTQILSFLNEKQRELAADTDVLLTCFTASTVTSQQEYSVPGAFFSIQAIKLYRTTGDSAKRWLQQCRIDQLDPSMPEGSPIKFALWGGAVSGTNSMMFYLDPIPDAGGTGDLRIYVRKMPSTMVSGGQGPDVVERWQHAVVDGALASIYRRFAEGDGASLALADRYEAKWQEHKNAAAAWIAVQVSRGHMPRDTMGYTSGWIG